MTTRRRWTREELLVAFGLYCQMPYRMIQSNNPEIVPYAEAIGRTPAALAMKMWNIASLDDTIKDAGLPNASATDRAMWAEMNEDWDGFALGVREGVSSDGAGFNLGG